MVAALVHLQFYSWLNLLLTQLRRLRKPQYLFGLLAALSYFGLLILRPLGSPPSSTSGGPPNISPAGLASFGPSVEHLAAGGLFLLAGLTWLLPSKRAGLDFTEAEIAWLFPAPIPRRTLVHFRLLRTQAGLVFSAFIFALVSASISHRPFQAATMASWWVLMSALELHRQVAGFSRTRLLDHGIPNWVRRGVVVVILAAVSLRVWNGVLRHTDELAELGPLSLNKLEPLIQEVLGEGVIGWMLLPFRVLARTMTASDLYALAWALLPAVGLLLVLYFWALFTAVGFEDESLDQAQRRARIVEAARSGNWHLARENTTEARAPFPLPPYGPRLLALTWKNLISAQAMLGAPALVISAISMLLGLVALRWTSAEGTFLKVLGAMLAGVAPMVFVMGPELARFDLRQDLPQADVLKTLPLRGWQIVLGEVLAPVLVLTALQWLLITGAVIAFPGLGREALTTFGAQFGVGLSAIVLTPAINLALLLLHNATALLFPAWVRLGPGGAQGFEAMGQRMLLLMMHLAGLVLSMLVPAVFGVGLFFGVNMVATWTLALPVAAIVFALILTLECVLALKLLGDQFERFQVND